MFYQMKTHRFNHENFVPPREVSCRALGLLPLGMLTGAAVTVGLVGGALLWLCSIK
jgi:hypothetical protein